MSNELLMQRDFIDWAKQSSRAIDCPACGERGPKRFVLTAAQRRRDSGALALFACPACDSKFFPDLAPPHYQQLEDADAYLKFYLELGAGIDQLIRHLSVVRLGRDAHYLEVGCGFGFALDFAKYASGLTALGVDPSPFAAAGTRLLGVPIIQAYLAADTDLGERKFDLAVASEVIEHIFEPLPFIQRIAERLAGDGVLILTTPNAASVAPATSPGNLTPLLSVGWHYVLYSAQGLRRILRDAGFHRVEIVEREHTLVAAATNGSAPIDLTAEVQRDLYRRYLEERRKTVEAGSSLSHGLGYRLLKELVNAASYQRALEVYQELRREFALRYDFDLEEAPERWLFHLPHETFNSFATRYPMCLCGITYLRGLIALNLEQAHDRAAQYFSLSARYGGMLREQLQSVGADDAETELLAAHSQVLRLRALAYAAPNEAAEQTLELLQTIRTRAEHFAGERKAVVRIFAHLVNLGAFEAADRLAAEAESSLGDRHARIEPDGGDFQIAIHLALGLLELNGRKAPLKGALHFARAERAAKRLFLQGKNSALEQIWRARRNRLIAWFVAGRVQRALLVALLWCTAETRFAMTRERLLELFLDGLTTDKPGHDEGNAPQRAFAGRLLAYAFPHEAAARLRSRQQTELTHAMVLAPEQKEAAGAFVDLVNSGMLKAAEPLAAASEALLNASLPDPGLVPNRLRFEIRRALGLLEINERGNPRRAALHFALAERAATKWGRETPSSEAANSVWMARHGRLLAWVVAGNAQRAILAGNAFVRADQNLIPDDLAAGAHRLIAQASRSMLSVDESRGAPVQAPE